MCKAKIIRMTGFFGIVFASLFLLQSPLFVQDSSAVSDIIVTIDSSNYSAQSVLCEASACSPYHYLVVSYNGTVDYSNGLPSKNVRLNFGSYMGQPSYFSTFPSTSIVELDTSSNSLYYAVIQSGGSNLSSFFSSGGSIIFTLSEDNPFASGIIPSGSLSITENGTFDVTNYAEAVVDVPSSGGSNYHQDLVDLKQAIYTGVAVLLVIYFFWMIYRIIIINTRR